MQTNKQTIFLVLVQLFHKMWVGFGHHAFGFDKLQSIVHAQRQIFGQQIRQHTSGASAFALGTMHQNIALLDGSMPMYELHGCGQIQFGNGLCFAVDPIQL